MRTKQCSHLFDSRRVSAITMTDQQSFVVEPDHVTSFGFSRRLNLPERRDANAATEFNVPLRFRNAIHFAGMETNKSVVGSERWIVSVDRIERKVGTSRQMEYFGARGLKLPAQFVMLRLRDREIWRMKEAKLPPAIGIGRTVPTRRTRRAHQYSLHTFDHGMAIKTLAFGRRTLQFC